MIVPDIQIQIQIFIVVHYSQNLRRFHQIEKRKETSHHITKINVLSEPKEYRL